MNADFFSLTPEHVLDATEKMGTRTTGLCYPLMSLENRVYELELEDGQRVVTKFYRPGRWSEAALRDEHAMLRALQDEEIPVCAPLTLPHGDTLARTEAGIWFAVWPRTGGRSPDELTLSEFAQVGRLLARMHNVAASLSMRNRPKLLPATYGLACLEDLVNSPLMSPSAKPGLVQAVEALVAHAEPLFCDVTLLPAHADCHRGNLLRGRDGFFFLDFDDMAWAPAMQDLWLLLPARAQDCPQQMDALMSGYRQFRDLAHREVRLIEALRGLRYVRYAAWVARRWADPAFQKTFTDFGNELSWMRLTSDILEQVRLISRLEAPLY